mmetsp:Transcript_1346/g.3904  ORF Transcript_1346/g.3904 Transcript_1346/m.3904 type:complete len:210 (+) Transcript_1346:3475-4104(+)
MTHCLMTTSSPITVRSWNDFDEGTSLPRMRSTHDVTEAVRYFAKNVPRYATMPEEINTSPVKLSYCSPRICEDTVHRDFSPPRPLMSFSAVMRRLPQISYWLFKSSDLAFAASRSATSLATLSCTSFSNAFFSFKDDMASDKLSSACFNCSFLGPTIFATASYTIIARTHLQIPHAATDPFLIASGSNSGSFSNGLNFAMVASGMLSLS